MIFQLSHPPLCFEIPDEWWFTAEMHGVVVSGRAYPHSSAAYDQVEICEVREVAPIIRTPETILDHRGFGRERMLNVLVGLRQGAAMPPVEVVKLDAATEEGFRYRLVHGFHRFYGSVAVGYSQVPAAIVPNWRRLPGSPFRSFGDEGHEG